MRGRWRWRGRGELAWPVAQVGWVRCTWNVWVVGLGKLVGMRVSNAHDKTGICRTYGGCVVSFSDPRAHALG